MSISVCEHDEHAVALLDAVGQRFAIAFDIRRSGQRHFRRPAEARQRRAQIVRDVVERAAHAGDQTLDPVQHRVEEPRQLADRIVICSDRHAFVGAPGPDDAAGGLGQIAGSAAAPTASPASHP